MKEKKNRGITLVALIITIVVLLILAVVAISAVSGNGILNHAQNAKTKYSEAQTNEAATISGYEDYIEDNLPGVAKKLEKNLDKVVSTTDNTPLVDKYGNKIMLPAGFKILVDSTTGYTADTIDVTKGIVVEDTQTETAGNQFVWIPVGKIYTDEAKTEANAKTITLGRYVFKSDGTIDEELSQSAPEGQVRLISASSYYYTEGKKNETTINEHAKDIETFISKTNASGGYYIGRYEARTKIERKKQTDDLTTVTLKVDDYVYNYISQRQASERCQSMYTSKPYESDLVNSYAWDTAIIFIQKFENSTYSRTKGQANDSKLSNTGLSILKETGKVDKQCNIYDMAGNCYEWSTETCSELFSTWTARGGNCDDSYYYTSMRDNTGATIDYYEYYSFRPVLYM